MTYVAQIDMHEITVTPRFKHITVENVPQSELMGYPVMETKEVVEVRFAGTKNYSPVMPTDGFWKRQGHMVLTYAERWPDQYAAFLNGSEQVADGTPLELLKPFGITPSQLSLCRALKIHSIEALNGIQGDAVRNLGMSGNSLRAMAKQYMDNRPGSAMASEIEALKAQIAALTAGNVIPEDERPLLEQVETLTAEADEDAQKAALKERIRIKTGNLPRGNPSVETLERMAQELDA